MAETVAVGAVMCGWALFGLSLVPILRRPRTTNRRRDRSSLLAMLLQGAGFALAWGWHRGRGEPFLVAGEAARFWIAALAAALALASAVFAVAAVRHLGRQWSLVARLSDEHRLVTTGPYAVVRHPIYAAMLGLMIATGLAFATPATLAVAIGVYLAGTTWRATSEERLLRGAFGEAYAAYAARVPRIIPFARQSGR